MPHQKVAPHLLQNYREYYSESLSEWRALGAINKAQNIITLCSARPHQSILDIGCGEGAVTQRLLDAGFAADILGLEISPSGLEMAHRRGLKAELFDGYEIPSQYGNRDLAILTHVVEHVEHPRKLIYSASNAARHVFVEVPLEDNIRLSSNYTFDPVGHINFYSPKTVRRLLQTCNLTVLEELISHASVPVYRYLHGNLKGHIHHAIKTCLLGLTPQVATRMFTYHYSAICSSPAT